MFIQSLFKLSIFVALHGMGVLSACAVDGTMLATNVTASPLVVDLQDQPERILIQPGGPFAVVHFPSESFGSYVGIVYWERIVRPGEGPWRFESRFWQDAVWASDVVSIAWSANGDSLWLSTSNVYGTVGIYRLNLNEKKAFAVVFPKTHPVTKDKLYPADSYHFTQRSTEGDCVRFRIGRSDGRSSSEYEVCHQLAVAPVS